MSTKLEIARDRPLMFLSYFGVPPVISEPTGFQTLDLTDAIFFGQNQENMDIGDTFGKYEDGAIVTNDDFPDGGYPDFYFPSLVLDRDLVYQFEFTFDPDDVRDDGSRSIWLGVLDDADPVEDYLNGTTTYNDLWDNTHLASDLITITIPTSVWVTEGTPEGSNTMFFETSMGSVLTQIRWRVVTPPAWTTVDLSTVEFFANGPNVYGQYADGVIKSNGIYTPSFFIPELSLDDDLYYEFEITFASEDFNYFGWLRRLDNTDFEFTDGFSYYVINDGAIVGNFITYIVGPSVGFWTAAHLAGYDSHSFDVGDDDEISQIRYRPII